jgi:hypothetical protein
MDPDRLAEMRAYAEEIREELAEREAAAENDPDLFMMKTREVPSALVYKTRMNAPRQRDTNFANELQNSDDDQPEFTDGQMDIVATVLAQVFTENETAIKAAVAPLREKIALMEGQLSALMTLLSGDTSRSIGANGIMKKLSYHNGDGHQQ